MTGMTGTRPGSEEHRCPPRRTCSSPRSRPLCAPSQTARAKGFPRPGLLGPACGEHRRGPGRRSARTRRGIVEARHRATAVVAHRDAPPVAARGDGSRRARVDHARRRRRLPPDRGRRAAPRRRRRADPDVARARRACSRPRSPFLTRLVNSAGARRRQRAADRALRPGIESVADELVLAPVERELAAHEALRRSLAIAAGERL